MEYELPSLELLLTYARGKLRSAYDAYKGRNQQRLSFITLFEYLASQLIKQRATSVIPVEEAERIRELLTAALLFEYAWIWQHEYAGESPEKNEERGMITKIVCYCCFFNKNDWQPKGGSRLYSILKTILNDTLHNQITLKICLQYVNIFYHFIGSSAYFSKSLFQAGNLIWKTKQHLHKDFLSVLKRLKDKEWDRLAPELEGPPIFSALPNNLKEANNYYYQIIASRTKSGCWATKQTHLSAVCFTDFVNETCHIYSVYKDDVTLNQIRSGAALFTLLIIYNEYKVLSPKTKIWHQGSDLFALYLHAMNVKGLWKTDPEIQAHDLNALLCYINEIHRAPDYADLIERWNKDGFDLDEYLHYVIQTIPEQQVQLRSPWWYENLLSYTTHYSSAALIARYGIPALSKLIFDTESSAISVLFYVLASALFMAQWSIFVSNNAIPRALRYARNCVLEKFGQMTSILNNDIHSEWSYEELDQYGDRSEIEDYIRDTILQLPEEILSIEEYEQLKIHFGFSKKDRSLEWLSDDIELTDIMQIHMTENQHRASLI